MCAKIIDYIRDACMWKPFLLDRGGVFHVVVPALLRIGSPAGRYWVNFLNMLLYLQSLHCN